MVSLVRTQSQAVDTDSEMIDQRGGLNKVCYADAFATLG